MTSIIRSVILAAMFLFYTSIHAQCPPDSLNMLKLYQYDAPTQGGASGVFYSDVWGYVDPDGREYGIIGSADSILIFDVTNTDSIYKADGKKCGVPEVWRDMKTYNEYLYAVCDYCPEGLLIYDLSNLPNSFSQINQITEDFTRAHNIYIETETARLYVVGSNGVTEGMLIYDLSVDPVNPELLKEIRLDTIQGEPAETDYYIHDIFVRRDTAYCSHGNTGYVLWDVSNTDSIYRISAPLPLKSFTNRSYVHSSWNTEDNDYAYVATESNETQIYIVDQTDKENPVLDTTWREPLLECLNRNNNVPHNPYIIGDKLYISYYQDGVNILDISDRQNPIRIGYYDVDNTNSTYSGTTSNWGVYPFLPSGTIIASDTRFGFFALQYVPPTVPLELISFEAKTVRNTTDASLEWQVADAINVSHFELEMSTDGIRFERIALLAYEPNKDSYNYIDKSRKSSSHYYRLKIVDVDHKFEYSDVRQLNFKNDLGISLYPTSTSDYVQLEVSSDKLIQIKMYNSSGQLLLETSALNGEQIFVGSLIPGIYTAVVQVDATLFQTKIIVN